MKKTKINIVSGFLGSGKTSFIKKLIKESDDFSKTVIIENEFGEVSIDGAILERGTFCQGDKCRLYMLLSSR